MSQSHDFNILKVLLITSAARCTDLHLESHNCVLFPQLDRNSVTVLIAVSARTISWGFVDASSLLAAIQTCTHPPMPNAAFHNHFFGIFSGVQLITFAATCTDLHWVPWFCIIFTARLQQCHWANRCLCTQHLMRICRCKAHYSLQYRPVNTLPCPMQQLTYNLFGFSKSTAHHICSQVHWFAWSPMFLYHFHSLTATVPLG